MAATNDFTLISLPCTEKATLVKWKVKSGTRVSHGNIIALFKVDGDNAVKKLKSNGVGIVRELMVTEGDVVPPGAVVVTLGTLPNSRACAHPIVMKDMCAECGADLREEMGRPGDRKAPVKASVAMVHSVPELIVSEEQALELGRADEGRLLQSRKLVLLVDLDQTLIHTTNDNIPPNLKDAYHFQLPHGPASNSLWYHTKFRPGTDQFLKKISSMYELHICTFGVRLYAHTIARFLDPEGKFFSHRILSRDECFSSNSKTANLKALFPCGDSLVCIIDDREDVWQFAPNLVHVKPYHFFQGTADINAPPGLSKTEDDSESHVHKTIVHGKAANKDGCNNESVDDKASDNNNSKTKTDEAKHENNSKTQTDTKKDKSETPTDVANIENDKKSELDQAMVATDNSGYDQSGTEKQDSNISSSQSDKSNIGTHISENISNSSDNVHEYKNIEEKMDTSSCHKELEDGEISQSSDEPISDVKIAQNIAVSRETADSIEEDSSLQQIKSVTSPDQLETELKACDNEENMAVDSSMKESAVSETDQDSSKQTHISEDSTQSLSDDIRVEKSDKKPEIIEKPSTDVNNSSAVSKEDTQGEAKDQENNESGTSKDDTKSEKKDKEDETIEWEDEDDYLYYLEDILTRVHCAYFNLYDQMKNKRDKVPDLKNIIPYVKRKVLKGVNIVFSGVVPTNTPMEQHRAFITAKALGANIQSGFVPRREGGIADATTHVIAAKLGTVKVNQAMKHGGVDIVTPEWLWVCAERWEKVEERLFPLKSSMKPGHDSPDPSKIKSSLISSNKRKLEEDLTSVFYDPVTGKRVSKSRKLNSNGSTMQTNINTSDKLPNSNISDRKFSDSYNPLFSFSKEDICDMDKEVDEIFDESDDDSSKEDEENQREDLRKRVISGEDSDLSSEESLSGEFPRGWKSKQKQKVLRLSKKAQEDAVDKESEEDDVYEEEGDKPVRRLHIKLGEDESSRGSDSDDYMDSIGSVDEEMVAALEKEFPLN